jgi:hypothetical protein
MDRVNQKLQQIALPLLALSAALLFIVYGLDFPSTDQGVYPIHLWSTAGAIVGWCLVLASLVAFGRTATSRWIGGLSALALIAGPANVFVAFGGFFGACLLLALVSATAIVRNYGRRGRLVGALGLAVTGVAAAFFSQRFSSTAILDSPPTFALSALVVSPLFIGAFSIWSKLRNQPARKREPLQRGRPFTRLAPRPLAWWIVGMVLLYSLLLALGPGVVLLTIGVTDLGLFFTGYGLLLAVLPGLYTVSTSVALVDGVLSKVVFYRIGARCSVESLARIQWYQRGLYGFQIGYEFRRADGKPIFKLSSFWWSHKDVAELASVLGIAVSGGQAAEEQRRHFPVAQAAPIASAGTK